MINSIQRVIIIAGTVLVLLAGAYPHHSAVLSTGDKLIAFPMGRALILQSTDERVFHVLQAHNAGSGYRLDHEGFALSAEINYARALYEILLIILLTTGLSLTFSRARPFASKV